MDRSLAPWRSAPLTRLTIRQGRGGRKKEGWRQDISGPASTPLFREILARCYRPPGATGVSLPVQKGWRRSVQTSCLRSADSRRRKELEPRPESAARRASGRRPPRDRQRLRRLLERAQHLPVNVFAGGNDAAGLDH